MEAEGILISPPETPSQPSVPPHADIEVDVDLDDLKAPALAQTAPGLPLTGATDDALDRIAADIASEYKTRGLIIDESGLMNEVFDRHGKLLTPQQAEAVLKRREDDDMKKPVESPRADFAAVAKPPAADAPVVVAARTPPKRNENYQTAPQKVMLSPDIENDPGYKSAVAFVQNVVVDRAAKTVVPSDIAQEVLGKTPADKDYADAHKKAQTILAAMEKNNIVDKPNALGARKVTPVTIPADIHDRPTPVPPKPPTLKDAFKEEVTPVYSKEQQKTLLGMAQDIQRAHDAGKKKPTDTKPGK